jgi:hypothetical protein
LIGSYYSFYSCTSASNLVPAILFSMALAVALHIRFEARTASGVTLSLAIAREFYNINFTFITEK